MKKSWKNIIAVFVLFVVFAAAYISLIKYFSKTETAITDFKIKYSTQDGLFGKTFSYPSKDIVIIEIDDIMQYELAQVSPQKYAPWPWDRKIWSDIINYIEKAEPKVVMINEIFSGYEDNSLGISSNDGILANTLSKYDNIVLSTHLGTKLGNDSDNDIEIYDENPFAPVYKPVEIISTDSKIEKNITYLSSSQIPDIFVRNAYIAGNNLEDDKENFKYFQPVFKLISNSQTYYIPSPALISAMKFLNSDSEIIIQKDKLTFANREIPLNKNASTAINWHGTTQYERIPLSALINAINSNSGYLRFDDKTIPLSTLKGKAIIISDTIKNKNLKKTPLFAKVSAGEIYATILDNIINDADTNNLVRRKFLIDTPNYINIIVTLCLSVIICLLGLKLKNPAAYLILTLLVCVSYSAANILLFYYPDFRYNLPVIMPTYFIVTSYILTNVYKILNSINKYAKINNLYGNYISKETVNKFMQTTNLPLGKTINKNITVLICDVKNFSKYAENYDSQLLLSKLNELFTMITEEIYAHNGIIYKFIEDSVIAYWGAPISTEDDAYNAVKCALSINKKVKDNKISLNDKDAFEVKIAINTGNSIIGCVKTNNITEYNIMGEGLNFAKKIEKICSMTEKSMLMSENTYNETKMKIQSSYKGEMKIKGRETKIKVYEPVGIIKG